MNTTQTKLTTIERRAFNFCQHLLKMNGGNIGVEWKKSAMYGYNPVIDFNGKCTNVSGCGYDKLSTALADFLRFLFPSNSEDHRTVWTTGGCGEQSTVDALAARGWKLERTASGKTFDGFELSRIA